MTVGEFFSGYDFDLNLKEVKIDKWIKGFSRERNCVLYVPVGDTASTRLFAEYNIGIHRQFEKCQYVLHSIPDANRFLDENLETYLRYYVPNVDYLEYKGRDVFDILELSKFFQMKAPGAYLVFSSYNFPDYGYFVHRIESDNPDCLQRELIALLKPELFFAHKKVDIPEAWKKLMSPSNTRQSTIASISGIPNDGKADLYFSTEAYKIADEIKELVKKLELTGMTRDAILKLVGLNEIPASRMHIDGQYRIFLTDYDNREIVMEPLPKAVYFLFLRHPEGIRFKYLSDYRSGLRHIYNVITGGKRLSSAIEDSINRVTDPCDNSINEKCSRARGAFIKEISSDIVDKYYAIKGLIGGPKYIGIDRSLISWDRPID